jgi:hypothetical protein
MMRLSILSLLTLPFVVQAEKDWRKLCALFDGEFDNYDQLEDLSCAPQFGGCSGEKHTPLHSVFRRVDDKANLTGVLPGDGCVLYVEQYTDRVPSHVYRQKLYVVHPNLTMNLWGFANPQSVLGADRQPQLLDGIAPPMVYDLRGCELQWSWNASAAMFQGTTDPQSCSLTINGTKHVITDDNTLSENFITIHEHWTPAIPGTNSKLPDKLYRWRQATQQSYTGFIYAANPQNMSQAGFLSNIALLNNGQFHKLHTGDAGWFVEVAVCHYSVNETAADHSGAEVLKLAIYREGAHQAMTYAFVTPGAPSVGLTYRDITSTNVLVQAEFKLISDAPHFPVALV